MSWHPDDAYDAAALSREEAAEVAAPAAVLDELRAAVERAPSAARWARRHGVGPGYLADVLSGRRPPGAKILSALGIDRAFVRGRP
ncbi:hypothetical protein [Methylobacterium dankookense]|uniref:HTH cro/C1-type domain-containing protein n=1 Tax=Methylobacterium dankookense TaxID=560405 RepID=A0A564FUG1_9HYPH|nr:hypothetical protein [Methylobacterium dankookense]GJD54853.1 hypothetical protein IFDJLNFL_0732 [Methylobacterium dankookense]VUF11071.1 hypothetical protein MTDSW087_00744 [Methylobacterium dankookense]